MRWMALVILVCTTSCAGESDRARDVRARLDAHLATLRADDATMRRALATLPAETGPCEVAADAIGPTLIGAGTPASAPRIDRFVEHTAGLHERADTISPAGARRWLDEYPDDWARYELVVVASAYEAPRLERDSYFGGSIDGRAIVWDHSTHAAVCASDVSITPEDDFVVEVLSGGGPDAASSEHSALRELQWHFLDVVLVRGRAALSAPGAE